MSDVLKFDPDDLTLGELCDIEDKAGADAIQKLTQNPPQVGVRAMAALVWVLRRREDPDFTYEAALDVRVAELDFEVPSAEGS